MSTSEIPLGIHLPVVLFRTQCRAHAMQLTRISACTRVGVLLQPVLSRTLSARQARNEAGSPLPWGHAYRQATHDMSVRRAQGPGLTLQRWATSWAASMAA